MLLCQDFDAVYIAALFAVVLAGLIYAGAWGPRMQDWWESVIALYNRVEAQPGLSRRQKGLSHTWSANSFTAWWAQRLSCAYVRHLFESVEKVAARGVYSTYNTRNGG